MSESESPIKQLIEHEKAMSDLYAAFKNIFPDTFDFWETLHKEEQSHIGALYQLSSKMNAGEVELKRPSWSDKDINKSIYFAKTGIEKASARSITVEEALNMARFMELGILEKNYFEIFEGDTDEIRSRFENLRKETETHLKRVDNKIKELSG